MTDSPQTPEATDAEAIEPPGPTSPRRPGVDRRRGAGDGLASLVGSGGSQVGTNAAMRARDVSRPR